MNIPDNEARKQIDEVISLATICDIIGYEDGDEAIMYLALEAVPGVTLIEKRNSKEDSFYRCAEYVFGTIMEEWWCDGKNQPEGLWDASLEFLASMGYKRVEHPQDLDVIAYIDGQNVTHYGVMNNGKVMSKFGPGPILEHEIGAVPSTWGDEAVFLRKMRRDNLIRLLRKTS